MLKIFIGVLAVFLCSAIGAAYSGAYKKRADFFALLLSFNSALKGNLVFRRENVAGILRSKKEYSALRGLYRSDEEEEKPTMPEFLAREQRAVINDYFATVGKNDGEAEERFLDYYDGIFKAEAEKCGAENMKYRSLGKKLGLSLGLVFFILIL